MDGIKRVGGLLLFMVRFFLLVVPLVVGWWALVPHYGMLLAQLAGGLAHYVLGMTVLGVGVRLEPETVLNTGTNILFQVPAADKPFHQFEMPVALLVTNLAPYLALVLATWGIPLLQRLKVLLIGSSIIIAGHVLFVTILLRFQEALKQYSEIATSTIQLFLVMPVLLWVWLVYSEKISAYLEEAEDQRIADNAGKQG